MTDIREEFEAWLLPSWSREKFVDGEGDLQYVEDWVQGAWIGWQASRAALKVENEALRKAFDEANEMLARIGDFAHDKSAGPAVPDALWEIRSMAYSAVRIDFDAALEGGGR